MTPINNNQMSELDKIIQEYAEILEEKLKLEPMTTDWIHRIIFFNTENLKADISTLISHERAEAVRGYIKWKLTKEWNKKVAPYTAGTTKEEQIEFRTREAEEYLSNERGK